MTHKTSCLLALASIISLQAAGAAQAADFSSPVSMKPLSGVSFEAGEKHGVGYFLNENNRCKLVLTIAAEPNWDDASSFSATRFEAVISAGKATRYQVSEGKALEFVCQNSARSMTVQSQDNFASAGR